MILILNEVLPEDLRSEIERDAQERGVSMNDTAGLILSERYGLKWVEETSPYRPMADRFKIRVTDDLHRAIRMDAAEDQGTVRGIVLSLLASHYGLPEISPHRRPRRAPA